MHKCVKLRATSSPINTVHVNLIERTKLHTFKKNLTTLVILKTTVVLNQVCSSFEESKPFEG